MKIPGAFAVAALFAHSFAAQCEIAELQASDSADTDGFGTEVALDGTRAVIGSGTFLSFVGNHTAYVFDETPAGWVESAALTVPDAVAIEFGLAVDVLGDRLVVGAPADDTMGTNSGAVFVYELSGGLWTPAATLYVPAPAGKERFGTSLLLLPDRLIVGARGQIGDDGQVFVFDHAGGVWSHVVTLAGSIFGTTDTFGTSLAWSGTELLVGAPDKGLFDVGGAYLFDEALGWAETAVLSAPTPVPFSDFGFHVALDGDTAMVSARENVDGQVYVFERVGGAWSFDEQLVPDDPTDFDLTGVVVELDGDRAFAGAPGVELLPSSPMDSGAVFEFERSGGSWSQVAELAAESPVKNGAYGVSLDLSEGRLLVGAQGTATISPPVAGRAHLVAVDAGFETYGAGLAGTGGLVPSLTGDGCPSPGADLTVSVSDGLPGAPGLLVAASTEASTPFAGGLILVGPPMATLAHVLDPTGELALAVDTPFNPSLVGLVLRLQAGYADAGAVFGVSLTNGLRILYG